jgi:hypothetical protein
MLPLSAYVETNASCYFHQANSSPQASGNSGNHMALALLATGKHTVTALTRAESSAPIPNGLQVRKIDYSNHTSIVDALKGQDALIITMSPMAPKDQQEKLISAAAEAKVQYIFPNEWSPDTANVTMANEALMHADLKKETQDLVESVGCSWIAVSTGFWYEWSLPISSSYGFDVANRTVTFFDDGETKITTSTWPQVGRAVANLLSLKFSPDGPGDSSPCLDMFKNKYVYIGSFTVSQKDMFESLLRVTNTTSDDWTVSKEPVKERYALGLKAMKEGDRTGFIRAMYSRVFFPDDGGNTEKTRGLANEILGLPKEDLDEATRVAVKRSQENKLGY